MLTDTCVCGNTIALPRYATNWEHTDGPTEGATRCPIAYAMPAREAALTGSDLIVIERRRQTTEEGRDPILDIGREADLALAGEAYARHAGLQMKLNATLTDEGHSTHWPWREEFWKPTTTPLRNLVRGGALLAASIDALLAGRSNERRSPQKGGE